MGNIRYKNFSPKVKYRLSLSYLVCKKYCISLCKHAHAIYRGYSIFLLNMAFISSSEVKNIFIIYKVVKYRKILLIYNVYFIFSLVKI